MRCNNAGKSKTRFFVEKITTADCHIEIKLAMKNICPYGETTHNIICL